MTKRKRTNNHRSWMTKSFFDTIMFLFVITVMAFIIRGLAILIGTAIKGDVIAPLSFEWSWIVATGVFVWATSAVGHINETRAMRDRDAIRSWLEREHRVVKRELERYERDERQRHDEETNE